MIIDLPDTSTAEVVRRLVRLRGDAGALALGRVLTLVIAVDGPHCEAAVTSAIQASHQHPSRIVVIVDEGRRGRSRLNGQIRVGGDAGAAEVILLHARGPVAGQPAALAVPLLLPDSPIVGWWPHRAPDDTEADPLGHLCQRRITDSATARNPGAELVRRAEHYRPGDSDLAWSRVTRWRAVLAAALDQAPFDPITDGIVVGAGDSPSTDLLAGWLSARLGVRIARARTPRGSGLVSVRLSRDSGDLDIYRPTGAERAALIQALHPPRRVPLIRRSDAECLADELRHLDADEVYHEALTTGIGRLAHTRSSAAVLERQGRIPAQRDARRVLRQGDRPAAAAG